MVRSIDISGGTMSSAAVFMNTTQFQSTTITFAARRDFLASAKGIGSIALVDLDGDATLDLVTEGDAFLGTTPSADTTATFTAEVPFTGTFGADRSSIAAADINGDGKPDLVVGSSGNAAGTYAIVAFNTTATGANAASFLPPQRSRPARCSVHSGSRLRISMEIADPTS